MADLYHIPQDTGYPWRLKKFVEYQHEVPPVDSYFIEAYVRRHNLTKDEALNLCWYDSVTYNEITSVLLTLVLTSDIDRFWAEHKEKLNFGSARKYSKNCDWFAPLIKQWNELTSGCPENWVKTFESASPVQMYRRLQKAVSRLKYVGRFGSDLFLEPVVHLKDYLQIEIAEPFTIDWDNGLNLTSAIFNILYMDEKAADYERTRRVANNDKYILTRGLYEIQNEISKTYPDQNTEVAYWSGKLCSFRNLFKGSRYAGFHHDRQLGVIREYQSTFPEHEQLWNECLEIRKEIYPHRFLGELHGWSGIRPERKKMFLRTGFTGAEEET